MDQTDPWQVVPKRVITLSLSDCSLISVAIVVLCHVGRLWVTNDKSV